ncbi:hypothetical protein OBBRIDRAFT_789572 [Obba rivulosa]|uniref:Uncharacterized protein n=1 Tax=Obba rivulosa TaxID=1052685 RepID=A0A8E2J458_9APHY|nr:hypothetical protein OBBRIDRAFT_789572 [Obba rivulosa]
MYCPQPQPTTLHPQTTTLSWHEASYIITVLKGRGVARKVVIAALDKDTEQVALVQ